MIRNQKRFGYLVACVNTLHACDMNHFNMSSAFSVKNENNEYIEKLSAEFTGYNMEDGRKRLLPELHQVEPKRGSGGVIRFFRTKNKKERTVIRSLILQYTATVNELLENLAWRLPCF